MSREARFFKFTLSATAGAILFGLVQIGSTAKNNKWPGTKAGEPTPKIQGIPPVLAKNLANFDDLDFRVYTNQQWQDLHKSHSKDVIVHWPDGHTTQGIERHIEDLKYMWTFAPDNRIKEHPARFGTQDGEWTAATGWLEGTFTKPMVLPDGKVISIPHLKKSAAGSIIVMSSVGGRFGYPNRSAYCTAKMGLIGFAKTLSRELGQYNIRVNAIAPGAVGGDRIERVLQGRASAEHKTLEEERAAAMSVQSLKRFVDPKDIAALILFLTSDAGKSISGQVLPIDNDAQTSS